MTTKQYNIDLSNRIKEKRAEFKIHQRELSAFENNVKPQDNHDKYDRSTSFKQIIYQDIFQLNSLRQEFRIKHITRSMAAGKSISEIEPKVSKLKYNVLVRDLVYGEVKELLLSSGKPWIE